MQKVVECMAGGFAAEQVVRCWRGVSALPSFTPFETCETRIPLQVFNVDTPIFTLTSSLMLLGMIFHVSVAAFCPVECIKSLPASNAPT